MTPDIESSRFAGAKLEEFQGKIYDLCKDQNGCRFLQKKLEESDSPDHLRMIFEEVQPHFGELMIEPFGNYLCQKLIEHCNDAERDLLVETVAPDLLKISLNMHGTRAVQRLIEFLSTPQQIHAVTVALDPNVVTLIKDLNGNHVIQKCLHRLSAEHKQFVYNAVSKHCIQVATHRHGCCVLQRCIDYASGAQKDQLVQVITWHALPLVQDPFGNYVVQYVLDLGDIHYTDTLIRCFLEHVCDLSVQKFSSNVIEKCIRVAEPETRRLLIAELMSEANIEKLIRDSFANYVVQTCLEYADQDQRVGLVELIRPLLPSIRSTPYGKRIHSKIQREQQSQQSQPSHPRRIRQHQSLGSLRFNSSTSSNPYQNTNDNALAFGLPLIGNNDPLYPYP
ncbi:armadillo-type protein [Dichotomocladium elegans]|nr:armadillo-type protein [Dichotomocladium elegans]